MTEYSSFFSIFSQILAISEDVIWGYIGFPIIICLGAFLSFKTRFVQIRKLPTIFRIFWQFLTYKGPVSAQGVSPIKTFFAGVGGCVGIGNVVGICSAAQIGGPGALFWIWVTAIAGMVIKYSEVYLGVKYRIVDSQGQYHGGPMFFLRRIFKGSLVPYLVCILLCIYGVEIYQFSVITSNLEVNLGVDKTLSTIVLLVLVLFAGSGGVQRVGGISSAIIPLFVVLYIGMGFWVLMQHYQEIPSLLGQVLKGAFTGHAALGGFVGSVWITTVSQGIRRGAYSGDIGVGYASVIHSETSVRSPERQASLVIFDLFVDTFVICTTSVLLVLATGVWQQDIEVTLLVQTALGTEFSHMQYFMPLFLFLLGYSTINAYFCVGIKCASYISPKWGTKIYFLYAIIMMILCSFVNTTEAQEIMAITNALLLAINSYGIYRMRNEISFNIVAEEQEEEKLVAPVQLPA